jgi:hypothetical protein
MWSRVYVVIVLGMVGYKGQELAAVRRRGRFLAVAVFWARDMCVVGRCLFYLRNVPYLAQPSSIWFYGFLRRLYGQLFFHNLTDADVFLSSALTSTTIRLSIHTAGFYDMRLLGLEKEGLGMLVWLE